MSDEYSRGYYGLNNGRGNLEDYHHGQAQRFWDDHFARKQLEAYAAPAQEIPSPRAERWSIDPQLERAFALPAGERIAQKKHQGERAIRTRLSTVACEMLIAFGLAFLLVHGNWRKPWALATIDSGLDRFFATYVTAEPLQVAWLTFALFMLLAVGSAVMVRRWVNHRPRLFVGFASMASLLWGYTAFTLATHWQAAPEGAWIAGGFAFLVAARLHRGEWRELRSRHGH